MPENTTEQTYKRGSKTSKRHRPYNHLQTRRNKIATRKRPQEDNAKNRNERTGIGAKYKPTQRNLTQDKIRRNDPMQETATGTENHTKTPNKMVKV